MIMDMIMDRIMDMIMDRMDVTLKNGYERCLGKNESSSSLSCDGTILESGCDVDCLTCLQPDLNFELAQPNKWCGADTAGGGGFCHNPAVRVTSSCPFILYYPVRVAI